MSVSHTEKNKTGTKIYHQQAAPTCQSQSESLWKQIILFLSSLLMTGSQNPLYCNFVRNLSHISKFLISKHNNTISAVLIYLFEVHFYLAINISYNYQVFPKPIVFRGTEIKIINYIFLVNKKLKISSER